MTKPPNLIVEEVANRMSAAAARAAKGLREVSDAIAELRETEAALMGLAASQMIVAKNQTPTTDENLRLAHTVPELAQMLGVSRKTLERRIKDGTLKSTSILGRRLVTAESIRALFEGE